MKIMLSNFSNKLKIEGALKLREKGIEILYWIGQKAIFDFYAKKNDEFFNTIFHNIIDAVQAIAAPGVDVDTLNPPSKQLIEDMFDCESQVLTMMDGVDFHATPINRRKHLYHKYIAYWYGILTTLKPDAVVFGDVPHIAHEYTLFCLARRLKIKTVMSTDVKRLPDRMIFLQDMTTYEELHCVYERLRQTTVGLDDLSPEIKEHYLLENDKTIDSTPVITKKDFLDAQKKNSRVVPSLRTIVKNIKRFSLFRITYYYINQLREKKSVPSLQEFTGSHFFLKRKIGKLNKGNKEFEKEYLRLQVTADFTKKYVYVPLHTQPERATCPEGGVFADQIMMIEMLASALPEGWVLYVKEHPSQWIMYRGFLGRYKGYYEELTRKKHVFLVPMTTQTFDLIEHAQAVASVTGTASWEGILRGIPTLLFGNIFFMHCEGVFRVSSVDECRKAFKKIEHGYTPDRQQVVAFLKAADEVCVRVQDHHKYNKYSEMSDEENIKQYTEGYYKVLCAPNLTSFGTF